MTVNFLCHSAPSAEGRKTRPEYDNHSSHREELLRPRHQNSSWRSG